MAVAGALLGVGRRVSQGRTVAARYAVGVVAVGVCYLMT